jgi:hypothetical protein
LLLTGAAVGDITYTPIDPATYGFGVGLYDPANPGALNSVYVDPAYLSDEFTFTFAIHCNDIYYNAEALHFAFGYDNSSIEVVHAFPVGGWTMDNYASFPSWPNSSTGWQEVASLTQGFTLSTDFEAFDTSAIVPFMQVHLHIKSDQVSQLNDFGVVAMTLISHTYALTLTPADFIYGMGTIHEVPEPSAMLLLGGAAAAIAGGVARRRARL